MLYGLAFAREEAVEFYPDEPVLVGEHGAHHVAPVNDLRVPRHPRDQGRELDEDLGAWRHLFVEAEAGAIEREAAQLALGLIAGLTVTAVLPEELHLVVGVGFLGGYTTFSTASLETVRLLQERRWLLGALNGLGVVVAATDAFRELATVVRGALHSPQGMNGDADG